MSHALRRCFALGCALLLAACGHLAPAERTERALALAADAGWSPLRIETESFDLLALAPPAAGRTRRLHIYIEGDGLAWFDTSTPSPDPTPLRPMALELALRDPGAASAYLARPCQYVTGGERRGCELGLWTQRRFAPLVIDAMDAAVSRLKERFAAEELSLVGYSGGGAVAALVAARRPDVRRLVTVAGNLDTAAWVAHHRLTPLLGSLNPADAWPALAGIEQIHFVGGSDRAVPPLVARAFAARFPAERSPRIEVIEDFDHACCWPAAWAKLITAGE